MSKTTFKIMILSIGFVTFSGMAATGNSMFMSRPIFDNQPIVLASDSSWRLPESYPSVGVNPQVKTPSKAPSKKETKKKKAPAAKPKTIVKTKTVVEYIPSKEHNVAEKNVFPGQDPVHVALLRGWITALDQAMFTDNYSVLRQLGASQFTEQFKDEDLKAYFDGLKIQNIDLSPVLNVLPEFTAEIGTLEETPTLTLTGVFPLQPNALTIRIVYLAENNYWRVGAFQIDIGNDKVS